MNIHVMSLNCQGGEHHKELIPYLEDNTPAVDVICMQEIHRCTDSDVPDEIVAQDPGTRQNPIRVKLYREIAQMLEFEFECFFAPQLVGHLHDCEASNHSIQYGNALFVRKNLIISAYESGIIYRSFNKPYDGLASSKSMQIVCVHLNGIPTLIAHFHGFWTPAGKIDTPGRFEQNARVIEIIRKHRRNVFEDQDARILLLGDFNYTSQMMALQQLVHSDAFGSSGGVHLNKEYKVTDTRTKHYTKDVREADHAIVSRSLQTRRFSVDTDAPSDHAAMFVELQ